MYYVQFHNNNANNNVGVSVYGLRVQYNVNGIESTVTSL